MAMVTPYSTTERITERKEFYIDETYDVETVKANNDLLWRAMSIITLIASIVAILYLCKAVVQIDSYLFSVGAALFMGAWLYFMYRKVL